MSASLGSGRLISLNLSHPEKEVVKLSIRQLVGSLTLPQLWAVIGVGFTLMSAASGAAYYLRSNIAQAEEARAKLREEQLLQQINELSEKRRVDEKKQTLLTLRNRVQNQKATQTKRQPSGKQSADNNAQHETNQSVQAMAAFTEQIVGSGVDKNGIPDVSVLVGPTRADSKLLFRDGTTFDVPQPVKDATKHITWIESATAPLENVVRSLPRKKSSPLQREESGESLCPTRRQRDASPMSQPTRENNLLLRDKQSEF